ncbi:hypothetical protein F5Y09DRAFT_267828 [Xylaria sp. FL1042]|nr:hypothetical protein F5Y09DRAFT_267828 [Xylaria sp. FL1042]
MPDSLIFCVGLLILTIQLRPRRFSVLDTIYLIFNCFYLTRINRTTLTSSSDTQEYNNDAIPLCRYAYSRVSLNCLGCVMEGRISSSLLF